MGNVIDLKTENPDALQITFDDFWRAYPRRQAKKDALKAWRTVDPRAHGKILAAIRAWCQCDDWRRDGGRYIPFPATWLRGERWEDELDTAVSLGECCWNCNGTREAGPKCSQPAATEKNGLPYCRTHAARVA